MLCIFHALFFFHPKFDFQVSSRLRDLKGNGGIDASTVAWNWLTRRCLWKRIKPEENRSKDASPSFTRIRNVNKSTKVNAFKITFHKNNNNNIQQSI